MQCASTVEINQNNKNTLDSHTEPHTHTDTRTQLSQSVYHTTHTTHTYFKQKITALRQKHDGSWAGNLQHDGPCYQKVKLISDISSMDFCETSETTVRAKCANT